MKLKKKINILLIPKGKRDFLNEAQTRMNELINNTFKKYKSYLKYINSIKHTKILWELVHVSVLNQIPK